MGRQNPDNRTNEPNSLSSTGGKIPFLISVFKKQLCTTTENHLEVSDKADCFHLIYINVKATFWGLLHLCHILLHGHVIAYAANHMNMSASRLKFSLCVVSANAVAMFPSRSVSVTHQIKAVINKMGLLLTSSLFLPSPFTQPLQLMLFFPCLHLHQRLSLFSTTMPAYRCRSPLSSGMNGAFLSFPPCLFLPSLRSLVLLVNDAW